MRHHYRLFLLTFVLVIISACGQNNVPLPTLVPTLEPTVTNIPTSTPQTVTNETLEQARPALIRIINAVVDSPPLNVFAGFSAIATNLAYQQFTQSTSFDAGENTIKIQASGSAQGDAALLESNLTFPSGTAIMILITGNPDKLVLTVVPDKTEALKRDESIIHVVNGLSDSSTVALRSSNVDLTSALGTGRDALTPIIPAEATDLTFQIGDKTLDYAVTLKGQSNTTLIAVGNATSPAIVAFESKAPNRITVRAINAAPEITSVDVYIDDDLLESQVNYVRPSVRKNFASGQHTVRIYAAGADRATVEPLTGGVVTLQDGENFAVVLMGPASNLQIISFAESLAPTEANRTRISFLNTLSNLAEVDVQTTTTTIRGIPTLFYGQPPAVMEVEPGNYNFLMNAADSQNIRTTIEMAENVQLEAGYSYLYLVTGRQDGNPIIVSEKIDILATTEDGQTQPTGESSSVRFINAVDGQTLDFSINGAPALTGLNYGEGSGLVQVTEKNVTLIVNASGQTNPLGQQEGTFEADNNYTVIAYQAANGQVGTLIINDNTLIFDGSSPHLRFINASGDENSLLGLAFSEPNGTPSPATAVPVVTEEPTQDGNQPATVYTLPYGVQKLVSDVIPGSASTVILMANGIFDLDLINSANNKIAVTIPSLSFSGDMHLDVIAYQVSNSDEVKAFTVTYPKPQA